jgi:hypothetical protein
MRLFEKEMHFMLELKLFVTAQLCRGPHLGGIWLDFKTAVAPTLHCAGEWRGLDVHSLLELDPIMSAICSPHRRGRCKNATLFLGRLVEANRKFLQDRSADGKSIDYFLTQAYFSIEIQHVAFTLLGASHGPEMLRRRI